MPDPQHEEDTAPPADPFEAELVAYLDGELEPIAARRVESRLAADPKARARAAALKKTYDLLDYLPRPEPSATFTTRTLDRIPAIQASQPASPPANGSAALATPQPRSSQSVAAVAAPLPAAPASGSQPLLSIDPPSRSYPFAWVAATVLLASAFGAIGYFVAAALRPAHAQARLSSNSESAPEPLPVERRVIENLALYAGVEDLAFAEELARHEFFGDDPVVSLSPSFPSQPRPTLDSAAFAEQERAFRALPRDRQAAIGDLDRQVNDDPTAPRLLRVLEAYAVWLSALPAAERQAVLGAASRQRLEKVQAIRTRQWVERLPPNLRAQLATAVDRDARIQKLRTEEMQHRLEWAAARDPGQALDLGHTPWPFNSDARRAEVLAFAKLAFRLEEKPDAAGKPRLASDRLSANELDRYAAALAFAQAQGGEAWQIYGRTLYELLQKKSLDDLLLPPPAETKLSYTTFESLPTIYQNNPRILPPAVRPKIERSVGRWPEFPLKVHEEAHLPKGGSAKSDLPKVLPPLGPSKPAEYKLDVQAIISKLPLDDRRALVRSEGKWPEYPKELIRLARSHDLSVPEAMLPGSPKQWEAMYGKSK